MSFCQRWTQPNSNRWKVLIATAFFAIPFLIIVFLNWSVYKTAKHHATAAVIQIGSLQDPEMQQRRSTRQRTEWKAAEDVIIIITAFLLCYLPFFVESLFRRFVQSIEVPSEAIQVISCIFIASSLCNPIIYSIRKREFRTAVKDMFRRIGLCRNSNDINNGPFTNEWETASALNIRMRDFKEVWEGLEWTLSKEEVYLQCWSST